MMHAKHARWSVVTIAMVAFAPWPCPAADIQVGALAKVRPDTLSFVSAASFHDWQRVKALGEARVIAARELELESRRDAWRFHDAIPVKVKQLSGIRAAVTFICPGRLMRTTWFVSASELERDDRRGGISACRGRAP